MIFFLNFTCVGSRPSSVELNSLLMFGADVDDVVDDAADVDGVVDVDVDVVVAAADDFDFVASFKLLLLPSCQYCYNSEMQSKPIRTNVRTIKLRGNGWNGKPLNGSWHAATIHLVWQTCVHTIRMTMSMADLLDGFESMHRSPSAGYWPADYA